MTKLEIMNCNKKMYAKVEKEILTIKDPFEKLIASKLGLVWIKGTNWMGGMGSGAKYDNIYSKVFEPLGYSYEEVDDAFQRFMDAHSDINN